MAFNKSSTPRCMKYKRKFYEADDYLPKKETLKVDNGDISVPTHPDPNGISAPSTGGNTRSSNDLRRSTCDNSGSDKNGACPDARSCGSRESPCPQKKRRVSGSDPEKIATMRKDLNGPGTEALFQTLENPQTTHEICMALLNMAFWRPDTEPNVKTNATNVINPEETKSADVVKENMMSSASASNATMTGGTDDGSHITKQYFSSKSNHTSNILSMNNVVRLPDMTPRGLVNGQGRPAASNVTVKYTTLQPVTSVTPPGSMSMSTPGDESSSYVNNMETTLRDSTKMSNRCIPEPKLIQSKSDPHVVGSLVADEISRPVSRPHVISHSSQLIPNDRSDALVSRVIYLDRNQSLQVPPGQPGNHIRFIPLLQKATMNSTTDDHLYQSSLNSVCLLPGEVMGNELPDANPRGYEMNHSSSFCDPETRLSILNTHQHDQVTTTNDCQVQESKLIEKQNAEEFEKRQTFYQPSGDQCQSVCSPKSRYSTPSPSMVPSPTSSLSSPTSTPPSPYSLCGMEKPFSLFPKPAKGRLLSEIVHMMARRHRENYFMDWTTDRILGLPLDERPTVFPVTPQVKKELLSKSVMTENKKLAFSWYSTEHWGENFRNKMASGAFKTLSDAKREASQLWREYCPEYDCTRAVRIRDKDGTIMMKRTRAMSGSEFEYRQNLRKAKVNTVVEQIWAKRFVISELLLTNQVAGILDEIEAEKPGYKQPQDKIQQLADAIAFKLRKELISANDERI